MEKFNEIAVTVDRREMGMGRAVFLMIATLLLCAAVCCSSSTLPPTPAVLTGK